MSTGRSTLPALALAALLALALTVPAAADARSCRYSDARPGEVSPGKLRHATLCLVNRTRARRGLRRLRQDRKLAQAGLGHARDMVRRRYFAHTSLSGASFVRRIQRTGYLRRARRWAVGENLAWGFRSRSTPRAIVRSWLRSPAHRRTMLSRKWREAGMAVVRGTPEGHGLQGGTYANEFGIRRR